MSSEAIEEAWAQRFGEALPAAPENQLARGINNKIANSLTAESNETLSIISL